MRCALAVRSSCDVAWVTAATLAAAAAVAGGVRISLLTSHDEIMVTELLVAVDMFVSKWKQRAGSAPVEQSPSGDRVEIQIDNSVE